MKRKTQSVLLASLLTVALAACTTDRMGGSDTASTASPDPTTSAAYGSTSSTGSSGSTASTATSGTGADTGAASTSGSTASGSPDTMASGATGSTGAMDAGTATTTDPQSTGSQASTAGAMGAAPNSVVTMIEVVPRSGAATGAGSMAGAAVGGSTAASGDRVYRITLRMDDGSTRVVTQESAPSFRSGDRVHLSGGEIQRR